MVFALISIGVGNQPRNTGGNDAGCLKIRANVLDTSRTSLHEFFLDTHTHTHTYIYTCTYTYALCRQHDLVRNYGGDTPKNAIPNSVYIYIYIDHTYHLNLLSNTSCAQAYVQDNIAVVATINYRILYYS